MENYDLTYEGSEVQKILDTGDELQIAGYIFRGEATPATTPGTPTERVAYIGGPGTYTNFGSSITVPVGRICVFKYTGSAWSNQVIDTKVSDGAAYKGIATPTTNPGSPIGSEFYIAITAGTYTNFGNAVVAAGLNVLKYDGSAWSVDQVIAIDDEPIQGSDHLVKSGGVLNSIIQNGPAFDLSAYNAEGGVLATYADLSAALTALNALPADFKKGGMSIKFVLSSDNKYVQARLMANSFTTDVAQWQSVDIEPTAGSDNLVKSGGVVESLGKNIRNHFYNKNDGQKLTYFEGMLCTVLIPVTSSDYIVASTSKNGAIYNNYVAFDSDREPIQGYDTPSNVETRISPDTLPLNTAYIAFNASINDDLRVYVNGILVTELNRELNETTLSSVESISFKGKVLTDKYYNKSGVLSNFEGIACTPLIPVTNKDDILALTSFNASALNNYVVFDSTQKFIQGYDSASDAETFIQKNILPANTAFIAFNYRKGQEQIIYVNGRVAFSASNAIHQLERVELCLPQKHYYKTDGSQIYYNGIVSTPLIPISSVSYIVISTSFANGVSNNINYFNNRKEFLSSAVAEVSMPYMIWPTKIPSGAAYISINYLEAETMVVFVNGKIAYNSQMARSHKLTNKKLVTLGDSLTSNTVWQRRLAVISNIKCNLEEISKGVGYVNISDGTYTTDDKSSDINYRKAYRTAIPGTSIAPSSEDSIFIRSFDAKYYNPDIITIYGGANDPIENWKSADNTGTTPDEIVANEVPYKTFAVDNTVSTIAAYKGLIENLLTERPNAIIYLVTLMRMRFDIGKEVEGVIPFPDRQSVENYEETYRYPKVEYVRAIAKYYNLPLIDLWDKSGINNYNASAWYGATGDDCMQVHPNNDGYYRMADVMLQCL